MSRFGLRTTDRADRQGDQCPSLDEATATNADSIIIDAKNNTPKNVCTIPNEATDAMTTARNSRPDATSIPLGMIDVIRFNLSYGTIFLPHIRQMTAR
jgi:hypothetical protein